MYRYFRNISEDGCLNQKAKYEIHKKPFLTIDQNHENFKTNDRVKILFSEIVEKRFENVWHPVPTWTHIESESFSLQSSGSAAGLVVFFNNGYMIPSFSQITCGRHPSEACTDYYYFLGHL